MRALLIQPPLCQLNTPYPAISFLARALRQSGHSVEQRDLGLELVLRLYSREGLRRVFDAVEAMVEQGADLPAPAWRALSLRQAHEACVEGVLRFLQGRDRALGPRILDTPLLPSGPRLEAARLEDFGRMGTDDAARHLATLYLADLADLIASTVDPGFGLARYQHHLALGPITFDALAARLEEQSPVDALLDELVDSLPDAPLVGLSVPFPGCLYGALRIGRRLRARGAWVVMGGGYVNTELREVSEPRLWSFVDQLSYDDGEGPLLATIEHLEGGPDRRHRARSAAGLHQGPAPARAFNAAPDYQGLQLDRYLQLIDTLSPAHRLWSDGRWNKVILAHGCYWRRCAFCDIQLDYIRRYEPAQIRELVDQMEQIVLQTGQSGFHLVDEAAPPRLLKELALELLSRGHRWTFWGNIRFEEAFTPDLCRLLAAAGLVGVTGGLEVASDRLLQLMDKGITVAQAARACAAFRDAGVMVHAYLMYGFPSETAQETIDSAEVVRQLFESGLLQSAFWHRFVLTRHSGVAEDPHRFGLTVHHPGPVFAANDLPHQDPRGADPEPFEQPLSTSLDAWMRGEGLDRPVHSWFPRRAPPTRLPRDLIRRAIAPQLLHPLPAPSARALWLGGAPLLDDEGLVVVGMEEQELIYGSEAQLSWLGELLERCRPSEPPVLWEELAATFPGSLSAWSRKLERVRELGLLFLQGRGSVQAGESGG